MPNTITSCLAVYYKINMTNLIIKCERYRNNICSNLNNNIAKPKVQLSYDNLQLCYDNLQKGDVKKVMNSQDRINSILALLKIKTNSFIK